MSKGPYPFKESDITRAFNAAKKAGVHALVEIDHQTRNLRIIPIDVTKNIGDDGAIDNPWDSVLDADQKRAS